MQKSGKGRDISRARPLPNRWGEGQEAKARLELYGGLLLQKGGRSKMIVITIEILE